MVREYEERLVSEQRRPPHERTETSNRHSHGPTGFASTNDLWGRAGYLAAAAFAFGTGFKVYSASGIWPYSVPLGFLLYLVAIASLVSAFLVKRPLAAKPQSYLAVALFLTLVASIGYEIEYANTAYGTDAIAFAHVGAEVLLDSQNPYELADEPLGPVIERFNVPATFVTQTLSGTPIDRLISYPGGHVLAYAGGALVGLDDMRWVTVVFEIGAIAIMWWALLPAARSVLIVVLLIEPNLAVLFTSGGVTDWLWVLPLLAASLALVKGKFGWSGIAAGVAAAMKQQPWFAIPFIFIWIYKKSRHLEADAARNAVVSFVCGLVSAFVVLNLPFIVWSPQSWLSGVLTPALSDLVPDGQGISVLASRGIASIPQEAFTILLLAGFVGSLILYAKRFDRLQDLLWVFPPILLFLSYRSLHSYFIYWLPIAVFWLCLRANLAKHPFYVPRNAGRDHDGQGSNWPLLSAIGVVGLAAPLLLVSLGAPPLQVGAVTPQVADGVMSSVDVELTNNGQGPAIPAIDVFWGGHPVPWRVEDPVELHPGETKVVRALPASSAVIPPIERTEGSNMAYRPFRVRVHAKGESRFDSSHLLEVSLPNTALINPGLGLWGRISQTSGKSPFGWQYVERSGPESQLFAGPLGSGGGVSLQVVNSGPGREGWSEVGLTQDTSSLSTCYETRLKYSVNSVGTPSQSPGSLGIQLIQGSSSMWFVVTPADSRRVLDLPQDTRIVELPVEADTWVDLTLDLEPFIEGSGVVLGEPTTVKLFNALHQMVSGSQKLDLAYIAGCQLP